MGSGLLYAGLGAAGLVGLAALARARAGDPDQSDGGSGSGDPTRQICVPRGVLEHLDKYPPGCFSRPVAGYRALHHLCNWAYRSKRRWTHIVKDIGHWDAWLGPPTSEHYTAQRHLVEEWLAAGGDGKWDGLAYAYHLTNGRLRQADAIKARGRTGLDPKINQTKAKPWPDLPDDAVMACLGVHGADMGLSVWPPAAFISTEHREAWLAHAEQYLLARGKHSPIYQVADLYRWGPMPTGKGVQAQGWVKLKDRPGWTWAKKHGNLAGPTALSWNAFGDPSQDPWPMYCLTVLSLATIGAPGMARVEGLLERQSKTTFFDGVSKGFTETVLPAAIAVGVGGATKGVSGAMAAGLGSLVSKAHKMAAAGTANLASQAALPWHESWDGVWVPMEALGLRYLENKVDPVAARLIGTMAARATAPLKTITVQAKVAG